MICICLSQVLLHFVIHSQCTVVVRHSVNVLNKLWLQPFFFYSNTATCLICIPFWVALCSEVKCFVCEPRKWCTVHFASWGYFWQLLNSIESCSFVFLMLSLCHISRQQPFAGHFTVQIYSMVYVVGENFAFNQLCTAKNHLLLNK